MAIGQEGENEILTPPYQDWADYFDRAPRVSEDFIAAMKEMGRGSLPLGNREPEKSRTDS